MALLLNQFFLFSAAPAETVASLGGGWVGPAGDHRDYLFLSVARPTIVGNLATIFETRPRTERPTLGSSTAEQHALASMHLQADHFELWGGHRYLPGGSDFLSLPGAFVRTRTLPVSRRRGTAAAVVGAPAALLRPGSFVIEGLSGPGIIVQSSLGCVLLAHFAARLGALACRFSGQPSEHWQARGLLDLTHEPDVHADDRAGRRLFQGYGRLRLLRDSSTFLRVVALRRNAWDLAPSGGTRRGRAGAAVSELHPNPYLSARIAGSDRSGESYRLGELRAGNLSAQWSPLVRLREYRYAEWSLGATGTSELEEGTTSDDANEGAQDRGVPASDQSAALGVSLTRRGSALEVWAEGRRQGRPHLELGLRSRLFRGWATLGVNLMLRRPHGRDAVTYLESGSLREGSPLFYRTPERLLRVELKSEQVQLRLSSSLIRGRAEHFATLQMAWRFLGSGAIRPDTAESAE